MLLNIGLEKSGLNFLNFRKTELLVKEGVVLPLGVSRLLLGMLQMQLFARQIDSMGAFCSDAFCLLSNTCECLISYYGC